MEAHAHWYRHTVKEPKCSERAIHVQQFPSTCDIATVKNTDIMNVEFLLHIDLFDQLGCRKAEHALTPADLLSKCEKESDCQKEEEDIPFRRQRKDMVARSVPRVYDRKDRTADQEAHCAERGMRKSTLKAYLSRF